jgi:hypothetical protein
VMGLAPARSALLGGAARRQRERMTLTLRYARQGPELLGSRHSCTLGMLPREESLWGCDACLNPPRIALSAAEMQPPEWA